MPNILDSINYSSSYERIPTQNKSANASLRTNGNYGKNDSVTLSGSAQSHLQKNAASQTSSAGYEFDLSGVKLDRGASAKLQHDKQAISSKLQQPASAGTKGTKAQPQAAKVKSPASRYESKFSPASNQAESAASLTGQATTDNKLANYADDFAGKHFKKGQTKRCADFVSTMLKDSGAAPVGFEHQYSAAGLRKFGTPVEKKDDIQPGDVVFFKNTYRKGNTTHVGIYLGDGKFVHRPTSDKAVKIDSLTEGYYGKRYSGANRV